MYRAHKHVAIKTMSIICNLDVAIDTYHRALALRPDDTLSAEMLSKALEEVFNDLHTAACASVSQRGRQASRAGPRRPRRS